MIRHVVMWKLRGPSAEQRREQATRVREALEALRGKIPGLSSLEVGLAAPSDASDEALSHVVLISTHDDWRALEAYQTHPEHLRVAQLIGSLRTERRVVDFEAD